MARQQLPSKGHPSSQLRETRAQPDGIRDSIALLAAGKKLGLK